MRLVDSHCHLQADRFGADVELVVGGDRRAGGARPPPPGGGPRASHPALALVERLTWLDPAHGVHPHDAAKVDEAGWRRLAGFGPDPRVVAIGETGLDFDRVFSPIEDQRRTLRRNLALAIDTGKPAILHCRSAEGRRDAQDALLGELRDAGFGGASVAAAFGGRPPAVIHSYSGPVDYARAVLDLGLALSFSGLVFRPGEETSAEVASLVPVDRVLVETDSPFLAPPGAPRSRNEPQYVSITAAWLGDARGANPDELGERLVAAYDGIFRRGRAR